MNEKAAAPTDDFSKAAAAHARVRATIDALRADYDATEAEIERTDAELNRQLNLRLPPDEMKRAVIEILSANANRFERDMRAAVCAFVQHKHGDLTLPPGVCGKPMAYADIESIIAGKFGQYAYTGILRANKEPYIFDAPMFVLFGQVISERMLSILAGIGPEEMGYDQISESDVGCGLDERRELIDRIQADLAALHAHRADLSTKLVALGYQVPYKPNR